MKTKRLPSVTIGIPAYNEEKNIGVLLQTLLKQDRTDFILDQILVYSDGSNDRTVKIVKSFRHSLIRIVENRRRNGLAYGLNHIINNCNSDVLAILNADIIPAGSDFIEKMVLPIINYKTDLTAASLKEMWSIFYLEKVFKTGTEIKNKICSSLNNNENLYTCHGCARAFSKRIYKRIHFKESIGDDAYSYLFCAYKNFRYKYIKEAVAYYRLPGSLKDFYFQHLRFEQSKKILEKEFDPCWVKSLYFIPTKIILKSAWDSFLIHPAETLLYFVFLAWTHLKIFISQKDLSNSWEISVSTKELYKYEE